MDHLSSCIINLDLSALREAWSHLDQRYFARLEHSFLGTAKKLENALLRMYLVTCLSSGRHDKLLDFFEKMTPDLHGQPEWKEWFGTYLSISANGKVMKSLHLNLSIDKIKIQ